MTVTNIFVYYLCFCWSCWSWQVAHRRPRLIYHIIQVWTRLGSVGALLPLLCVPPLPHDNNPSHGTITRLLPGKAQSQSVLMTSPPNVLRAEPFQHQDKSLVLETSTDELRLSHHAIAVNIQSGEKVPGSLDGVEVGAVSVWVL